MVLGLRGWGVGGRGVGAEGGGSVSQTEGGRGVGGMGGGPWNASACKPQPGPRVCGQIINLVNAQPLVFTEAAPGPAGSRFFDFRPLLARLVPFRLDFVPEPIFQLLRWFRGLPDRA